MNEENGLKDKAQMISVRLIVQRKPSRLCLAPRLPFPPCSLLGPLPACFQQSHPAAMLWPAAGVWVRVAQPAESLARMSKKRKGVPLGTREFGRKMYKEPRGVSVPPGTYRPHDFR